MRKSDVSIISCLRTDARTSIIQLSRAVNLCRAAISKRVKTYELYMHKYTMLLDFQKLGFFHVLFFICLEKEDKEIFGKYIQQHPALNTLYETTNVDYAGEMIFKTYADVEDFFEALDHAFHITEKRMFIVKKELAKECFLQKNSPVELSMIEVAQ